MWSDNATITEEKTDCNERSECHAEMEKMSVKCTCPKCGVTHFLKFLWTGNGTPRKYCHRCREVISGINDQFVYESVPDVFHIRHGYGQTAPSD